MKLEISKDIVKFSGVYCIKNTINEKIYIGSAVNFYQRYLQHKHTLLNNKHNKRLQNFVNKYGIDCLYMNIIEICDVSLLLEKEQYWIDKFQSYEKELGFNICPIAGSSLGATMPDSHKEKSKERMKGNTYMLGKHHSDDIKAMLSEISKKSWEENRDNRTETNQKIANKRKGIPQWEDNPHPLLGKEHPAKGKKRSKEFCELMRKQKLENNGMRGVKLSNERKEQIKKQVRKPVALIDKSGNILRTFISQKEATDELDLPKGAVARVCKGEYKQTKGYRFKYL